MQGTYRSQGRVLLSVRAKRKYSIWVRLFTCVKTPTIVILFILFCCSKNTYHELYPLTFLSVPYRLSATGTVLYLECKTLRSNFGLVRDGISWHESKCHWGSHRTYISPWVWKSSGQTSVPPKLLIHTLFLSTFNRHMGLLFLGRWLSRFVSVTSVPTSYCHHLHIPWIAYSSLLFARQRFQDPSTCFSKVVKFQVLFKVNSNTEDPRQTSRVAI